MGYKGWSGGGAGVCGLCGGRFEGGGVTGGWSASRPRDGLT